jgi:hypothetical protein
LDHLVAWRNLLFKAGIMPCAHMSLLRTARLTRRRAFPLPVQWVLFGPRTVHSLDDAEHHHHKAMFGQVLTVDQPRATGGSCRVLAGDEAAGHGKCAPFSGTHLVLGGRRSPTCGGVGDGLLVHAVEDKSVGRRRGHGPPVGGRRSGRA